MSISVSSKPLQPTTFSRRLIVFVYEAFLLFAVLFAAAIPITVGFNITYGDPRYPVLVIYLYAFAFLYFGWCWTRAGQTLAMKTWKLQLVSRNGGPVTWKQSAIRYGVACISLLAFGLGFLWALFNKNKDTWHGLASSTKLIRVAR